MHHFAILFKFKEGLTNFHKEMCVTLILQVLVGLLVVMKACRERPKGHGERDNITQWRTPDPVGETHHLQIKRGDARPVCGLRPASSGKTSWMRPSMPCPRPLLLAENT